VKPFLLLATRAEDAAADDEYDLFLRFTGLSEADLRRHRLEQRALGGLDLRDWSGIFLGGGPFNTSDPETSKSAVQRRVEADLRAVLDQVVGDDFPFLGACYGIGTLGSHQGATVDRQYGEPVGPVTVTLTPAGQQDPLLSGLPAAFDAFRIGSRVYATQFHPELDAAGLCARMDVYKYAGYFRPEQADELKALAQRSNVVHAPDVLRSFVDVYARTGAAAS
jgi:GMP synthase (glutamine-hydrolysing)